MITDFDQLQALRSCCRDEAAFAQLQQILTESPDDYTSSSRIVDSLTQPRAFRQQEATPRQASDALQQAQKHSLTSISCLKA